MASAGTVTVDFAAETAKFTTDLKKVNDRLKNMEGGFESLGRLAKNFLPAVSVGALIGFARGIAQAAGEMDRLSQKTGIAVESLSRLQFAAEQADTEFSSLTTAVTQFQKRLGSGDAERALNRIGVSLGTIKDLSPEDQLIEIARGFESLADPAKRVSVAMELFGKAGADILPFLSKGPEGLKKLTESAEAMSTIAVAALDDASEAGERFLRTLKNISINTAGDFVARAFGTGKEALDAQVKLQDLQNQQARALAKGFSTTAIDQQIEAQEKLLVKLREVAALQEQARNPKFASNHGQLPPDLLGGEIEVRSDRRRIPGAPENADEMLQDFADQAREAELERQKVFASAQIDLARTTLEQINNDTTSALTNQLAFEERIFQQKDELRQRDSEAQQEFLATKVAMEKGALNASLGLLQALAGRSKAAAIALIAINKGLAIARAIQNTAVAASQALATVPYPANLAAAAQMKLLGGIEIATIAATGFVEAGNVSRGGASFGSSVNPVFTSNADTSFNNDSRATASAERVVQIVFNGNVYNTDDFKKSVADALKELDDVDTVVFSPTGAQAQVIRSV